MEEERNRGRQDNQKMKAYFVMRLLQKNTDFDHLMTSGQIAELLDSYDISAQEKSIQRDIKAVNAALEVEDNLSIWIKNACFNAGFFYCLRIFIL